MKTDSIQNIVRFLESHGNYFAAQDEPYEQMHAELQDWSFQEPGRMVLWVGYWFEENGDLVPDPNIIVELVGETVTRVQIETCLGRCQNDVDFAMDVLDVIWDRHFSKRCI
jgi:hypothetical protein